MNVQSTVSIFPNVSPVAQPESMSPGVPRAEPSPATEVTTALPAPEKVPDGKVAPNYRLDGEPSDPDVTLGGRFDEFF